MFEDFLASCRQVWRAGRDFAGCAADPRPRLRPGIERLEDRLCPSGTTQHLGPLMFHITQGLPPVITIPNLHKGDQFTVTAEFVEDESDVGDVLSEIAESMAIGHAGGGGFFVSPGQRDQRTFTATRDGDDSITVAALDLGGDETEVVTIDINRGGTPRFTPDERATLKKAADRFEREAAALFAIGALVCARAKVAGPDLAVACGLAFGTFIASDKERAADLKAAAEDPPDANFTTIAKPNNPSVSRLKPVHGLLTRGAAGALNALFAAQAKEIGLMGAIMTAINRASGASAAHDLFFETNQLQAAAHSAGQLAKVLRTEPALRRKAVGALKSAGLTLALTPNDFRTFQQDVGRNGLPGFLTAPLRQFGLDDAALEQIRLSILAQDPAAVAGSFPDTLADPELIGDLRGAAASVRIDTSLADVRDASGQVSVRRQKGVVTIRNVGGQPLEGPLDLVRGSLNHALQPPFREGHIRGPDPFVSVNVPGNVLRPGETVSVVVPGGVPVSAHVLASTGSGS
jgi:hypothetical protein